MCVRDVSSMNPHATKTPKDPPEYKTCLTKHHLRRINTCRKEKKNWAYLKVYSIKKENALTMLEGEASVTAPVATLKNAGTALAFFLFSIE